MIRLRSLSHRNRAVMQQMMEALGEGVNIKQILFSKGKWYCFFTLGPEQLRDPLTGKDRIEETVEKNLKE